MNRSLGLALLGLALLAGHASANGFGYPAYNNCGPWGVIPGYVRVNGHLSLNWGTIGAGKLAGNYPNGVVPYQLGPWYLYWPYEAHFQTPALPMYPYWSAATLPNGSPVINPGYPGHGAVPSYWGGGY